MAIDWGTVIVGLLSLIGVIVSNCINNSKTIYRIEQLEKKQDKHNSVIERVYKLEETQAITDEKMDTISRRVDRLEKVS